MSGISSIGSTTPTTIQILEAELLTHPQHPSPTLATGADPSAADDPSASSVGGISNTAPTSSQILEAELRTHLLHKHTPHPGTTHPGATAAAEADQSASGGESTEIDEAA